jgi:LysR family transcriptional regulator, nitrogen assimilation regulatory protein
MDVRQLRCFLATVEEGSLSAAAVKLQLAQPSLSQHVAKLEEELGTQLLVRTPRGITPTDAGQALAGHARTILEAMTLAEQDVKNFGGEPQGSVSIGLPSSLSMILSVPLAETITNDYPKIGLRLVEAMSGDIQSWITESSIDLGFLYDVQQLRHLASRPLFEEQLFLVAAPDNWSRPSDKPLSLAEVADLPLVLPSRKHGLREMIERHARARNVSLNVVLEIDALTQIKALVARASAYTILAHAAVLDEVERNELVLVQITDPAMVRVVSLVRNPSRVVTRASLEVERLSSLLLQELVWRRKWRAKIIDKSQS